MSVRVTSQSLGTRVLEDLRAAQAKVARSQREVSTGKRLQQASDDALGTYDALRLRSALTGVARDQASVGDATAWVSATDRSLSEMSGIVQRARELALQGANGATSASGRAAIGKEIGQLVEAAKDAANTKVGDQYVFGGTATTTRPYTPGTVDLYGGDAGVVARQIGPGVSVQVNVVGGQILGSGGGDGLLIDTLRSIQANLAAGNVNALGTTNLRALDANLDTISAAQSGAGALQNRLDAADSRLTDAKLTAMDLLGRAEDVDPVAAIMRLNAQSAAYQGALKAAANVLQPSLLDFLR